MLKQRCEGKLESPGSLQFRYLDCLNLDRLCLSHADKSQLFKYQEFAQSTEGHIAFPTGFPQGLVETKSILIRFLHLDWDGKAHSMEIKPQKPGRALRWIEQFDGWISFIMHHPKPAAVSLSSQSIRLGAQSSRGYKCDVWFAPPAPSLILWQTQRWLM